MAQTTTTAPPRQTRARTTGTTRGPASGAAATRRGEDRRHHRLPVGVMYEIRLPFIGMVAIPSIERLTYYAALAALAAFRLIDWRLALIIGLGHALAEQNLFRSLKGIGQAAEAV
ncbi:hypothetical protein DQ384_17625 [Sphaerisporangium album]|uniref:Uncharacterized protein n=1 Tax=Sphaerisporangium album TaxID=509200 RepID=A0A367FJA6_9ACTN|nr:hypothetical protein [Sphaerisporangium album]RCG29979.1 hypothetical protein DQ384_17625 [Sphaerisporangium album]